MSIDKTERPEDCTLRLSLIYRLKIHGGKQGGGKETEMQCPSEMEQDPMVLPQHVVSLPFVCEITLAKE